MYGLLEISTIGMAEFKYVTLTKQAGKLKIEEKYKNFVQELPLADITDWQQFFWKNTEQLTFSWGKTNYSFIKYGGKSLA